jgi:hypothetical protein
MSDRTYSTPRSFDQWNTPLDFPSLEAWWKADSLSQADGTPVGDPDPNNTTANWYDQSGKGHTAYQETNGVGQLQTRPTFRINQVGSLPGLDITSGGRLAVSPAVSFLGNFTILAVYKQTAANDGSLFGNGTTNVQFRVNNGGTRKNSFFDVTHQALSDVFTTSQTALTLGVWRRAGLTAYFRENFTTRNLTPTNNVGASVLINQICRNGGFGVPFNGFVFEFLIFNTSLSPEDIGRLYNNYLKPKWGLP